MVEPTNFIPRFLRSFEIASDNGEVVRISQGSKITLPSVNPQIYLSNEPYSF